MKTLYNHDGLKRCSKCKEYKPASDFRKKSGAKCGLTSRCKECLKEYGVFYYHKNKKIIEEKVSNWKKRNPEVVKRYTKIMLINNSKAIKNSKRKWNDKNPNYSAANKKKHADSLTDAYIKGLLRQQSLPLNQEVLEIKRLTIKIKRYVKKNTND